MLDFYTDFVRKCLTFLLELCWWKVGRLLVGLLIADKIEWKHGIPSSNHMTKWNLFDVVNSVNLK